MRTTKVKPKGIWTCTNLEPRELPVAASDQAIHHGDAYSDMGCPFARTGRIHRHPHGRALVAHSLSTHPLRQYRPNLLLPVGIWIQDTFIELQDSGYNFSSLGYSPPVRLAPPDLGGERNGDATNMGRGRGGATRFGRGRGGGR